MIYSLLMENIMLVLGWTGASTRNGWPEEQAEVFLCVVFNSPGHGRFDWCLSRGGDRIVVLASRKLLRWSSVPNPPLGLLPPLQMWGWEGVKTHRWLLARGWLHMRSADHEGWRSALSAHFHLRQRHTKLTVLQVVDHKKWRGGLDVTTKLWVII